MGDLDEAGVLLDPRIWIECAGVMARLPAVGSYVYYFVEGHAENVGLQTCGLPRPMVRCRVIDVRLLSNSEEVLAKIHLFPVNDEFVNDEGGNMIFDAEDRLLSAAKVLSNSDITSKFTVTQHCINHIFPKLVPPETSQMIPTHDVHGRSWIWRHTCKSKRNKGGFNELTNWKKFASTKNLKKGDKIVFMKDANNAITVGIARKRSSALRAQNVRDAIGMAMDGQPFEVAYYPRSFGPQYCVPVSLFNAAFDVDWRRVTRFKMKFESEDSTDFKWFKGTVTSVEYSGPRVWKCMKVIWDDPSRKEEWVNPWDVEPIFPPPNMPGPESSINLPGLDSSKKSDSPSKVFGVKLNSEEQILHGQLSGCQRQEEGTHEALELREGGSGYIGKGVSKNNDGSQKILGEQLRDLYKLFVTRKQSHGVVLSDTRSKFLAVGDEFVIKFWDMDSVNHLMTTDAEGGLLASRCIRFDKDGILLAFSASENGVKILANANGVRLMRSIENRSLDASRVTAGIVAMNNDGPQKILGEQLKDLYKSFVTRKRSHGVVLSDTRSRLMTTDAEGGLLASRCIRFNKDGILLAVSASENGVKILANANGVRLMRSIENRSLDALIVTAGTVAKGAISCTFGTFSSAAGTSIGVADRSAQGTAMVALNGDCRSLSDVKPRITDEIEKSKFWKLTEIKDPSQLCFPDSLLSVRRVEKAMKEKSCNALLLKVNRIGSEAEKISKQVGWGVMARRHSGETEDTFIADLRWFVNGTGAPRRSERLAKNNQHMPNEEDIVSESNYAGTSFCMPVEPY